MKTKHNVYTYQIIKAVIIIAFGLSGIAFYLNPDPMRAFFWLLTGYAGAFIFNYLCCSVPNGSSLNKWLFKEW